MPEFNIEFEDVTYSYPGQKVSAISNVNINEEGNVEAGKEFLKWIYKDENYLSYLLFWPELIYPIRVGIEDMPGYKSWLEGHYYYEEIKRGMETLPKSTLEDSYFGGCPWAVQSVSLEYFKRA